MDAIEKIARAFAGPENGENWHNFAEDAADAARRINAAGFAIVPQEPTEAMIKASCVFNRHHVTDCYKAMLAAGQVRPDAS